MITLVASCQLLFAKLPKVVPQSPLAYDPSERRKYAAHFCFWLVFVLTWIEGRFHLTRFFV